MEKLWVRCNYDDNLNRISAINRRGGRDDYTSVDNCLDCPMLHKSENNPNYEMKYIRCRGGTFKRLYPAGDLLVLKSDLGLTPEIEERQRQRILKEEAIRAQMYEENKKILNEKDNGPITREMVERRLPDRRHI